MEPIKQYYRKTTVLFLLTLSLLATSQMVYSVSNSYPWTLTRYTFSGKYYPCDTCNDPHAKPIYTVEHGKLYVKEGFILNDRIREEIFVLEPIPSENRTKAETDLATLNAIEGKFIDSLDYWMIHEKQSPNSNFTRSAETYTINDIPYVIVSVKGSGGSTTGGGTVTSGKPTVTLTADQANASEAGPTNGRFLIKFDAPRSKNLTVAYAISGTAKNGKDYTKIKSKVTIPAGQSSATVDIAPVDDLKVEKTEKVTLKLKKAGAYKLSASKSATVEISDND